MWGYNLKNGRHLQKKQHTAAQPGVGDPLRFPMREGRAPETETEGEERGGALMRGASRARGWGPELRLDWPPLTQDSCVCEGAAHRQRVAPVLCRTPGGCQQDCMCRALPELLKRPRPRRGLKSSQGHRGRACAHSLREQEAELEGHRPREGEPRSQPVFGHVCSCSTPGPTHRLTERTSQVPSGSGAPNIVS